MKKLENLDKYLKNRNLQFNDDLKKLHKRSK